MIQAPFLVPFFASVCAPSPAPEPSGTYVEARTLSVFAGACHFSGERTTAGREAVLAWNVEAGAYAGVDLSGARVVLAVVDDVNLDDEPSARHAVVYVDANESSARAAALVEWVRDTVPGLVSDVHTVARTSVSLAIDDSTYALSVGDAIELRGSAMPDRACCKMPYQVWYTPFCPLTGRLVGLDETFRFAEPALDRTWSRPDENAAFFGRFGVTDVRASR